MKVSQESLAFLGENYYSIFDKQVVVVHLLEIQLQRSTKRFNNNNNKKVYLKMLNLSCSYDVFSRAIIKIVYYKYSFSIDAK